MAGICKNLVQWASADPLVNLPDFDRSQPGPLYALAKRGLDLIAGLSCLAVTWPVLLVVAMLRTRPGGAWTLVRERRIGRNGHQFFTYRLVPKAAAQPEQRALRTSVEYLPQLFNVVRGDMSLVGPAPLDPKKSNRELGVQPGLIHLQAGYAFDVRDDDRARLDAFYSRHRSFLLDLQILVQFLRTRLWAGLAWRSARMA